MKKAFVKTDSVKQFLSAMSRLQNARPGIPKMALCDGKFGVGRTDTALWFAAQHDSVKFIRLVSLMKGPWLLSTILAELGHSPARKIADRFQQCVDVLLEKQYTLIFDEVDYIVGDRTTIEALRDLHDITGTIIVFIGMEDTDKRLRRFPHLNDRITERIRFSDLRPEDVRAAASELCEVKISADGIAYLHSIAARFRPLIIALYTAEALARANSLKEVTAADLAGRKK